MTKTAIAGELRAIERELFTAKTSRAASEPPKLAGRPDHRTDHDRLLSGVDTALARLRAVLGTLDTSTGS